MQAGRAKLAQSTGITAERVLEEYRRLAYADTTNAIYIVNGQTYVKDTADLTVEQRAAIKEITQTKDGGIRIKFHSKTAALDSLSKHLGLFDADNVRKLEFTTPPVFQLVPVKKEEEKGNG